MNQKKMKQQVAKAAVHHVKPGMKIGIGSGSTVAFFIEYLAQNDDLKGSISAISTSLDTSLMLAENGIKEINLHSLKGKLDLTVDGADEVSEDLFLIKGGGAALLREKIVAHASKTFIVIVDKSKLVKRLGKFPVPVEVVLFGLNQVINSIKELDMECRNISVRKCKGKLGPLLTDNGNAILDCSFNSIENPLELNKELNSIPGVVEHGIFTRKPDKVLVAYPEGLKELDQL